MGQRVCSQCAEECVGAGSVVSLSEVNKEAARNEGLQLADSKGRPWQESTFPEVLKFLVTLKKQDGETSFGLAHVPMDDGTSCLLIVDYKDDGPVGRWNADRIAEGQPEQAMQPGDRIVAVGSITDMDGMRTLLRQDKVQFSVERWPKTFCVTLRRATASEKLGIHTEIHQKDNGEQELRVTGIVHGLLSDWNHTVWNSRRFFEIVSLNAQIMSVDGVDGPALRMQQLLKENTDIEIIFRRPPPEEYKP